MAMKRGLAFTFAVAVTALSAHADDARDVAYLTDVINTRLETSRTGVEEAWVNPTTGNHGTIAILSTDESNPERPCRTYRLTTESADRPSTVVEGTACRVAPRIWQRTEVAVSASPSADPAPVARTEPAEPPPVIPPPGRKPDPDVFFASVPTPSDYR